MGNRMNEVLDRAYTFVQIEASADEDFDLSLTLLEKQEDGSDAPLDLTNGGAIASPILDFYIRPRFDHSTLIRRLSSDLTYGGVTIDDAATGRISLFVSRANVIAGIPVGRWDHFLVWNIGGRYEEIFRGPLLVHPGRI